MSELGLSLSNADIHDGSFEPTLVAGLGYTDNQAQLMSVPPFAASCARAYFDNDFSDTRSCLISVHHIVHHIGPLPMSWIHHDIFLFFKGDRFHHVLRYVEAIH